MHKLKLLIPALTLSLCIPFSSVNASTIEEANTSGESEAILSAEPALFNVTLPTGLPVHVASDGTITVSDSAYITNNCAANVSVADVEIETLNDWIHTYHDTDWSAKNVDDKEFSFVLFDDCTKGELDDITIFTSNTLLVDYDSMLPPSLMR